MTEHAAPNARRNTRYPGTDILAALSAHAPTPDQRARITALATTLVGHLRAAKDPALMETFLAEYGLSTDEGVALMCLAEALLRVPDTATVDALIDDKITPSRWGEHLGRSSSSLVNASTWALMLTGRVLDTDEMVPGMGKTLRGLVRRVGEPVIRAAVARAMRELGGQFVLGETIAEARRRRKRGYTYSYDMLGEAAMTDADAQGYFRDYRDAILALAPHCRSETIAENPGISVKLSALHPRYDELQRARVMAELLPRITDLALMAADSDMGLNLDAEEADRLDLNLDIFEAVLSATPADWTGLGLVVQAYGRRVAETLDRVEAVTARTGRRVMVRLVKGAYWDTEIKRAQVDGVADYPVFETKAETDRAYLSAAHRLLAAPGVYPQFATHNAHTAAGVIVLSDDLGRPRDAWEFQRLHGMGEILHDHLMREYGARCRIYAPVGAHRDLLAYLVRRLLENGANSSFVSQVTDVDVPIAEVVADPFAARPNSSQNSRLPKPSEIFGDRVNSRGWDLRDSGDRDAFLRARANYQEAQWEAAPLLAGKTRPRPAQPVTNPASGQVVGTVRDASDVDIETALAAAKPWTADRRTRAEALRAAADRMEDHSGEFFALLAREAGKTPLDAIAELREAVDFLRYYAEQGLALTGRPRGTITAISPWNFPLAIFTGQVAAALMAGNAVLAKPAEATPLIAHRAVQILHDAGVPKAALQYLPGQGASVGASLTSDPRVDGVVFTGSTPTAQAIHRSIAAHLDPDALLIAETGGINAMIVDSTALPEQAVRDILASAFQSAGQRCSALRCLYVQDVIADDLLEMLFGAMDELSLGDPWALSTDIGPTISADAAAGIRDYLKAADVVKSIPVPDSLPQTFVAPSVVAVDGIFDIPREVFGPVLHVARFRARDLDGVVTDINARGFGLTFGLHTRIDDRVERITDTVRAGNIYVNRNQIGAVVGSQPFGGEGLSGTGPKAGGPAYLPRFEGEDLPDRDGVEGVQADPAAAQTALDALPPVSPEPLSEHSLPGPTGESNRLEVHPRGSVLCLGPTLEDARAQVEAAIAHSCSALAVCPGASALGGIDGRLDRDALRTLDGMTAVALWSGPRDRRAARRTLAARSGPILPLIGGRDFTPATTERHVCIDTTAAGGNAALLGEVAARG